MRLKLLIVIYLWSNFHVNSLCSFEIREGGSKWPTPQSSHSQKKPSLGRVKGNFSADHDEQALNFCWINCHFVRSIILSMKDLWKFCLIKMIKQTNFSNHMFLLEIWSVIDLINDPALVYIKSLFIEVTWVKLFFV